MKTVSDHVREWADSLQLLVDSLLEHSAISDGELRREDFPQHRAEIRDEEIGARQGMLQ